jgi:hypothetical protein
MGSQLDDGADNPWRLPALIRHACLLSDSFRRHTGRPLIDALPADPAEAARCLYQAPFVLLSHGIQADPLFNYANLAAQRLWELDWAHFIGMPSRHSAEPEQRAERSRALADALGGGLLEGYSGVRIAASGRRFMIEDGTIWNLLDADGLRRGQAATFSRWHYLPDGAS